MKTRTGMVMIEVVSDAPLKVLKSRENWECWTPTHGTSIRGIRVDVADATKRKR